MLRVTSSRPRTNGLCQSRMPRLRCARHEHGCQQAAGGPRSQRDHEGNRLCEHHNDQEFEREVRVQDVADRVVSHAEDPRHKVTNDSEPKRADRWPPEFVNGQLLELIFSPIQQPAEDQFEKDRKSTRLNSSHSSISYAVFCLKKKKKKKNKKQNIKKIK